VYDIYLLIFVLNDIQIKADAIRGEAYHRIQILLPDDVSAR